MIARAWLVVGFMAAAGIGCRHHGSPNIAEASAIASDSLIGIVSVTGTSFAQQLVLRTSAGSRAIVASSGDDSTALARLGGAEVVVHGAMIADHFAVSRFVVRTVDGAHVVDGVLVRDGRRFILRSRDGDIALGNAPAAFDSLIGARLWVGGPLDSGPNVYGLITPPHE